MVLIKKEDESHMNINHDIKKINLNHNEMIRLSTKSHESQVWIKKKKVYTLYGSTSHEHRYIFPFEFCILISISTTLIKLKFLLCMVKPHVLFVVF